LHDGTIPAEGLGSVGHSSALYWISFILGEEKVRHFLTFRVGDVNLLKKG
jgi:hypothetical protein